MHSTEIDEFLLAHNSDIPKRLDVYLTVGMKSQKPGQQTLNVLQNVSIKAWDDRGVIVNFHSPSVADLFLTWGAINYIEEHRDR